MVVRPENKRMGCTVKYDQTIRSWIQIHRCTIQINSRNNPYAIFKWNPYS